MGLAGNGPALFAKETSSKSSEGLTQETTGKFPPEDTPIEKTTPKRGMISSL